MVPDAPFTSAEGYDSTETPFTFVIENKISSLMDVKVHCARAWVSILGELEEDQWDG